MTSLLNFKNRFLSELAIQPAGQEVHHTTAQLSQRFGVPEPDVRELLLQWAREQLFSMRTWSAANWKAVSWQEWPGDANSFFLNPDDANCIRITLLAAGREYAEILTKKQIGFAPVV